MLKMKTWFLVVAILGFVFAADSLGLAADEAAPGAAGAITLSSNTKGRDAIADTESGWKRSLLNPSAPGSREDNGYGLREGEGGADDSELSQTGRCSTEVILATFFKSRYCTSGTLVVAASSGLNNTANLEVVGYGPMSWDSKIQVWVIRVQNLETNPGKVTVAGAECTAQGEIMTVPFGCDARVGLGSELVE